MNKNCPVSTNARHSWTRRHGLVVHRGDLRYRRSCSLCGKFKHEPYVARDVHRKHTGLPC